MMASRPTGIIIAPPMPCSRARGHHHRRAQRQAAQHRSQREDGDRGAEHAPRAVAVGHPAADRNADRQAQDVAGDDRFQAQRRDVQAGGDVGTAVLTMVASSCSMNRAVATTHGR